MRRLFFLMVSLAICLCETNFYAAESAANAVITIPVSEDTYIQEGVLTPNHNAGQLNFDGLTTNPHTRRAYLRFNIPSDFTQTDGLLLLRYVHKGGNNTPESYVQARTVLPVVAAMPDWSNLTFANSGEVSQQTALTGTLIGQSSARISPKNTADGTVVYIDVSSLLTASIAGKQIDIQLATSEARSANYTTNYIYSKENGNPDYVPVLEFRSFDVPDIFTDTSCSELKSGVSLSDINALPSGIYKDIASKLFYNNYSTYEKEFRIQDYDDAEDPENVQARTKMRLRNGRRDNPTGIYVHKGDVLEVFVGNTHGQSVSIDIQRDYDELQAENNKEKSIQGNNYALFTGRNTIVAPHKGLIYVVYQTQTGQEAPVRIHFATGRVNGYYDKNKHAHTDAEWKARRDFATYDHWDVKGDYVVMCFKKSKYQECGKKTYEIKNYGISLINTIDRMIYNECVWTGLVKYNRMPINRLYFVTKADATPGTMLSADYYAGYNNNTVSAVLTLQTTGSGSNLTAVEKLDNGWGPAHEVGHAFEMPAFRVTEVATNIMSMYAMQTWNKTSRLMDNDIYTKAKANIINGDYAYSHDLWENLAIYWQIKLICEDVLGMPDFYKDLYEALRVKHVQSAGYIEQSYMEEVCRVSGYDFTDFFEAYKFDANNIAATRSNIAALQLPKPLITSLHQWYDITDGNISAFLPNVTVSATGYATLHYPKALTIPSGITAYKATSFNVGVSGLTALTSGVIPANTPVVIKGTANKTYAFVPDYSSTAMPPADNKLAGTTTYTNNTLAAGQAYLLSKTGTNPLFVPTSTETTIPPYQAYFKICNVQLSTTGVTLTTANPAGAVIYGENITVGFTVNQGRRIVRAMVNGACVDVSSGSLTIPVTDDQNIVIYAYPENVVPASEDTYIYDGSQPDPDNPSKVAHPYTEPLHYSDKDLYIRNNGAQTQRHTYLKFNKADFPADYKKATLRLYHAGVNLWTNNYALNVYPQPEHWDAATLHGKNEPTQHTSPSATCLLTPAMPQTTLIAGENTVKNILLSDELLTAASNDEDVSFRLYAPVAGNCQIRFASLENGTLEYVPTLVFTHPALKIPAGQTVAASTYQSAGDNAHGDVIFYSDDHSGTGQLTDASNFTPVNGVVKVVKKFEVDKWYPIGFPFEIADVSIRQNGIVRVGIVYDGDVDKEVDTGFTNGGRSDANFFVAYYDGVADRFKFTDTIEKDHAYVVEFPSDPFVTGEVEVTFTSTANPKLNSSGTTSVADGYRLLANPYVADLSSFSGAKAYYQYGLYAENNFGIVGGYDHPADRLSQALKPFEALVSYKGVDQVLRSSIGVGNSDVENGSKTVVYDKEVSREFYNLQGIRLHTPPTSGICIVKIIYASGKSEIVISGQ